MKKRPTFLLSMGCLALLFAPGALKAEETRAWTERLRIGVIGGPAFAAYQGSDLDDPVVEYSYRKGIFLGGTIAFDLTNILSIQLELDFSMKGARGGTPFPSTSGTPERSPHPKIATYCN
jgi:hypothetical protein